MITPAKWLELPMLRGDFDLLAQLELGEGADLDLIVRRVEPRPLQGVSRGFHGRFAALRLSTTAAGEPWRTPTEALFGEPGGVKLLAGVGATVQLTARGRRLVANVAGRVLPEYLSADEQGSLAFAVRGGSVAVRALQLTPIETPWSPHPAWAGLGLGVLLAGLALARHVRPAPMLAAAVMVLAATELSWRVAFADLPPLAQPEVGAEWRLALVGVPLALATLARGRAALLVGIVGLGVSGWLITTVVSDVGDRFPPTPELDAWFGPASREMATELLAQRVRGPTSVHTVEPVPHRVVLLGGQLLYRRGAAPDQHIEPLLTGVLRQAARDAEVVTAPTEDGWTGQQWRLFDRFLQGFRPAVLVLGVPRDEAVADPRTGQARSTPAELVATIAAARAYCVANAAALVLLLDDGVPAPFAAVARAVAAQGVPLIEVSGNDAASGIAHKLAAVIGPQLH